MDISNFRELVWDYYAHNSRDLLWRLPLEDGTFDPYRIMVSEIMLQQTQVSRVKVKYQEFLKAFPLVQDLAKAPLADVLRIWTGLGYNRRAKFIHQAARKVVDDYGGIFPDNQKELTKLPGIGANTAGAICAYAYNQPVVFIETNIRTVFIHHFFSDQTGIEDKQIVPLVEAHIDHNNPREWYWALMDYGSHLKKVVGNVTRQSQHYKRQSRFEGSHRQLRSLLLSVILEKAGLSMEMAYQVGSQWPRKQVARAIEELLNEGFIVLKEGALQSV